MSKVAAIGLSVSHDPVFWEAFDGVAPIDPPERTEWKPLAQVYFLLDPELGHVKIGMTRHSVERRVADHEKLRGRKLDLLGTLDGGWDLEKALHQRFRPYRRERREWYSPEILPEVMELLR